MTTRYQISRLLYMWNWVLTSIWRSPRAVSGVSTCALVLALLSSCGRQAPSNNGYDPQAVPGISQQRLLAVLGKPQSQAPFSVGGTTVHADVLTYPFGQVLVQNGNVVAISIDDDPAYTGPYGVTIGMSEDALRAALSARGRHAGHKESYDAIQNSIDTKTKDIYDDTDHIMIELVATNPNDPLAAFNVAQVTLATPAGMQLIDAFTKARVDGMYPDVHVDNFISNSWQIGR